ncbi:MAG: FAD synthetase family protein [Parachlamydiaceae bacterium]|nr:FAD synthetase family protein [Parachlamydiaceae bacterium]
MEIFLSYSEIPRGKAPIVLTIGNFDAVHSGHSTVLHRAREVADQVDGALYVLTFISHPSEVLRPGSTPPMLCTETHKLKLLQEQRVGGVILLEFTLAFSQQTATQFLFSLHQLQPFFALILGYDARIGNDRQGNSTLMKQLANELSFKLEYLPPYICQGLTVSSSAIRQAVSSGDFALAEMMLGRKFSIFSSGTIVPEMACLTIEVKGLCLPPLGIYPIKIYHEGKTTVGRGIVGLTSLTIELLRDDPSLEGKVVEVVFN